MKCSRIVIAISLIGPFLWLFGSVLFDGKSFGFRDSAYYYYPLFEWTAAEWGEGRVPLWNPLDNCGTPVVADSTSSIFYPGKLIFALPLAFYWRFKLYVLLHIGLAAFAAFVVARRWHASSGAAAICAMSYAFGGYVLFQHCNVVFLVSAAWLPFAVLFADRMLVKRSFPCAVAFGGTLALMVLGGDPQTAYHAGLLAALYALMLWRRERRVVRSKRRERPKERARLARAILRSRPAFLAYAAGIGGLLAAVQILPSMQWSRGSQRAMYERPRNVYEATSFLSHDVAEGDGEATDKLQETRRGLLDRPIPNTHHDHIYQFSLGPWRLTEMVWPNVSGRMYPTNRRWTNVIPGEDRIWMPSLYIGLLPLLLGLSAIRLRHGKVRERWLSWSAILATIGAFGWYGIGWLLHEFQVGLLDANPNSPTIGEPVGGLYWLMVVLLPGYAYFRFPAKLMVVATLALSLLAARGWDRSMSRPSKSLHWMLIVLACASAIGLLFLFVGTSVWFEWMSNTPGDDLWGPMDANGALGDLRFGLATTMTVSLLCLWLFKVRKSSENRFAKFVPYVLLVITAIDIAIANRWMIATVDDSRVTETSLVAQTISTARSSGRTSGNSRTYRGNPDRWVPPSWRWNSSEERIAENYTWQRATVFPRHNLSADMAYASSPGTISPMDYVTFLNVSSSFGLKRPDGIYEPHPTTLDALSVEYLLLPEGISYPTHQPVDGAELAPVPDDFSLWHNPNRFPRCWIVRDVEILPPIDAKNADVIAGRTQEVLFPSGHLRDWRRTAVIECDNPPVNLYTLSASQNAEHEWCDLVAEEPGRIELNVKLNSPALIVLNDYFYPGWTATLESSASDGSEQLEILRTNRVMRGVILPKGEHHLVFDYQPSSFRLGTLISGLAWIVVGVTTAAVVLRGRLGQSSKAA